MDLIDDFIYIVHVVVSLLLEMTRCANTRRIELLIKHVGHWFRLFTTTEKVTVFVYAVQRARKSFAVKAPLVLVRDVVKCVTHIVDYINVVRLSINFIALLLLLVCLDLYQLW